MFLFKYGLCVSIYSLNCFAPPKSLIPFNTLCCYEDCPESLRSGSNLDEKSRLEERDKHKVFLQ